MSHDSPRHDSSDVRALGLLLVICSFAAATARASGSPAAANWALVVAAGGCGASIHRLLARPAAARERLGYDFGLVAALSGALLFGSALVLGTPTNPVTGGLAVRAVGSLSLGALVVSTLATVTYLVGAIRERRESPEQQADRILEQVTGRDRR